jgi:hypothetical protein
MSTGKGIYLIVESGGDELQKTDGGYPHITFVYTGKCDIQPLADAGIKACLEMMKAPVTLVGAHMNSFEKDGKMRYDILADLDEDSIERIEQLRESAIDLDHGKVMIMRTPHITMHTVWSEEEAKAKMKDQFPFDVNVIGVCFN